MQEASLQFILCVIFDSCYKAPVSSVIADTCTADTVQLRSSDVARTALATRYAITFQMPFGLVKALAMPWRKITHMCPLPCLLYVEVPWVAKHAVRLCGCCLRDHCPLAASIEQPAVLSASMSHCQWQWSCQPHSCPTTHACN